MFKDIKEIENNLKLFFRIKKKEAKSFSNDIFKAISYLEDFTMRGGKRIRALLMILGYQAAGGKDLNSILKVSICPELVHSFLLIHDDIIDDDDIRRNGYTVHKSFQKKYSVKSSSDLAMITGDICLCYGLEPLIDSNFNSSFKIKAINKLGKIIKNTCYGEFMDVVSVKNNTSIKDIQKVHEYKTAKYTISGPLQLGAILAGSNDKILNVFDKFGLYLGLAFQLKDDILGIFGNQEKLGKPIGSDIREGKKTLLVLKANSKYINRRLGKKVSLQELNKIRKILIQSGSLEYSEKLIKKLINKARKVLADNKIPKKEKQILFEFCDYLNKREL
ncbi:MAG: polyprenyl synthetase family protein [Candidatus Woesearchaeota archaeon]